jgi:hypothetical protein
MVTQANTVAAHEDEGQHWIDGAVLDCLVEEYENEFDQIYNDLKEWENEFVTLKHSDWDGNIRIRIGDVLRVSNDGVQDTWDYYDTQENGTDELGDNRKIMLCGTWSFSEHNVWDNGTHIGRVNSSRTSGGPSAYKYWFHETGHAHTLCHRDGDYLMDPDQLYDMAMESNETSRWYDVYDERQEACDDYDTSTFGRGPSRSEIEEATPPEDFEQATVVNSAPIDNPTDESLGEIVARAMRAKGRSSKEIDNALNNSQKPD